MRVTQVVRAATTGLWRLYESVSWWPPASANPSNSIYSSHTIIRTKHRNSLSKEQYESGIPNWRDYPTVGWLWAHRHVDAMPSTAHHGYFGQLQRGVHQHTHIPSWPAQGQLAARLQTDITAVFSSSIPVCYAMDCYVTFCIPADNSYSNASLRFI